MTVALQDDVYTNDSTWVIATSAEEARALYEENKAKTKRTSTWEGEMDFKPAEGDAFAMYFEDAHEDDETCPLELKGGIECGKCSPVFTKAELIERFGHGKVIREYGC